MNTLSVASLIWNNKSQLHAAQADVVQQLGYHHRFFYFDDPIPKDTDILLIQGPYGSLLPLIRQLSALKKSQRPVLAYWFQQSLDLSHAQWREDILAQTFSDLHRHYQDAGWVGQMLHRMAPQFVGVKGRRLGFLGDIVWLHRHHMLDLLVLSSTVYANYFQQYGIPSLLVPRGYHPWYGRYNEKPKQKRDIDVVWMGKLRTKRRADAIYWLQEQLTQQGLTMHLYDGEGHGLIFDDERTDILNRTWFVLNTCFSGPTDELSIRYYLAGANGAALLTEPNANRYPFTPGKDILEASIDKMPEIIHYYKAHPAEWRTITENMFTLISQELTLKQSIARILEKASQRLGQHRGRSVYSDDREQPARKHRKQRERAYQLVG